jgi:RNA polymerase sigma factor (sigma-70 family)
MTEPGPTEASWIRETLDRYEGPLVRFTRTITGDLESARDVVQDAFCRLCAQPRDRVEGHVGEWLFAVCRNRALDVRKKEGRMTGLTEVDLDARTAPGPTPSAVAEGRDATERLLALVDGLPPNQAEVVRLKFQAGLSYKEISRVTTHSVTNVGFLLHTAIKTLRARAARAARTAGSGLTGRAQEAL